MTTKVIAGQIANTAIYELKDNNPYISQLPILEQEKIRDTIRNAALEVLSRIAKNIAKG
jgi:flagellar basal body rod protein FlgC